MLEQSEEMHYPLHETIGPSDLLVGRGQDFKEFHRWIANISNSDAKSRVIFGRPQNGKTSFVQRLYNQLWSSPAAQVIPFYLGSHSGRVSSQTLAITYYVTFASHYISFVERNRTFVSQLLSLEEIKDYGQAKGNQLFVKDVETLMNCQQSQNYDLMWETACHAPHRMALITNQPILVMINDFQFLAFCTDEPLHPELGRRKRPIDTLLASFYELPESPVAMLATGLYADWMMDDLEKHLESGWLSTIAFSPYLTEEEGLQAVHTYAELYEEPVTNETARLINQLCLSDPFFIACVIQSSHPKLDLTRSDGVREAVNYEISHRHAELSTTLTAYITKAVEQIHHKRGWQFLLHLSKHDGHSWSPCQLKKELNLKVSEDTIRRELITLARGELIVWHEQSQKFRGLQQGTINLVLRHRFKERIAQDQADPNLYFSFQEQIAELEQETAILQEKVIHLEEQLPRIRFLAPLKVKGQIIDKVIITHNIIAERLPSERLRYSTGYWHLSLSNKWLLAQDEIDMVHLHLNNEDEIKAIYLKTVDNEGVVFSDEEAARSLSLAHKNRIRSIEGYDFVPLVESHRQEGDLFTSTIELWDQSNMFRVLSKTYARYPVAVQFSYHDCLCDDITASRQCSEDILRKLTINIYS